MPNFARSRARSRRSARTLLLVPALLTALVGPMIPTGTALAATPAPAVSAPAPASARGAQAPDEPEPTATTTEPTPEPTATTTEPTPDPTATIEPTPEPTATTAPCPALALSPLGDPGDTVRQVEIEAQGSTCFTVTVEKPGTHRILLDGSHDTYPELYAGEDRVECQSWGYKAAWCDLAVGSYTLKLVNTDWSAARNRLALVPLMAGVPGDCPAVPGTAYDTAPATGTGAGPLGVVCHSFTAVPGERITRDLRRVSYGDSSDWISDTTGARLCAERNQDGSEGCVLPDGPVGTDGDQGPRTYRVYAVVGDEEDGAHAPYTLKVRRLSDPAGCATVAPSVYGTAPDRTGSATGCKTFTPTVSGRYDVRTVSAEGSRSTVAVYAQDGTFVCQAYDGLCTLTAGTAYTVLTDDAVQVFGRASREGCVDGVTLGAAYRGTFSAPGEVDCLNLPLPRGAHLAVQSDLTTDITVYDATGAEQCLAATNLWDATCVLGGTAPYRALVSDEDPYEGDDSYGLVVHRTDVPSACRTFTAGDFGTAPARTVVRTGGGVFAECLTIPAGSHSANELFQIAKGSGGSSAEAVVVDAKGRVSCEIRNYYGTFSVCDLTPDLAHTVLVQGRDVTAETVLTRQDVTATARGCVGTAAVAVGGPSTGGVPAAPGTFQCRRVTTPAAGDTLHLDVRDANDAVRLMAFDAEGDVVCDYFTKGCAATGSTAYQVLLQVPAGGTSPAAYRLDAARIGTPAGPAPECAPVANVSYGFGPVTGSLSEQHSTLCRSLPTAAGDRYSVAFSPAGTFATMPRPRMYDRTSRVNFCGGAYTSGGEVYQCSLPGGYPKTAKPSTLVIGLPEKPAQATTPVTAQFACDGYLCGPDERSLGTVGPATVGRGKVAMTVTGTALPASAKVVVTSGSFRAESTTLSVAPDRRSMTVALDLTRAPLGSLALSVHVFGAQYTKPSVTVVAALRSTAAPGISGTAVVGGKVTAKPGSWSLPVTSLAYQWRANGVAIAGATASTYTIPATLQGKQLSVAVVARKTGHPTLTAVSGAAAVQGVAPRATRTPSLSGTVRVGRTLTLNRGTWTPAPTSFAYQWYANGRAVSGATRATFTLTKAQRGTKITVRVTALRTGHLNGVAWTRSTGAVAG
ncbi:hypothetical protein [Streptomyces sp. NPDC014746]|uniref:hypothetical protein n=1 Tax=Streptomyces sp. NPDC014746 TaxID=3364904 RepID=UPI003701588C